MERVRRRVEKGRCEADGDDIDDDYDNEQICGLARNAGDAEAEKVCLGRSS